jgi:hypothetical protein
VNRDDPVVGVVGWILAAALVVLVYTLAICAYSITESVMDSRKGDAAGELPPPDRQ